MNLVIFPSGPLRGKLSFPGDKSISHRAVIFGSIAHGVTTIHNLLEGEDVLRTVKVFRALGVKITRSKKSRSRPAVWKIFGKGIEGLRRPRSILYCGNSGTTMRLMMGLLSGLQFRSVLTGDDSLNRRPMGRVADPLRQMGANIREVQRRGKRLMVIAGTRLGGIRYRSPVASAQVKSAILLAGLTTREKVSVTEPGLSRDHTERMLEGFGVVVRRTGLTVHLDARRTLRGQAITIAGDPSSAAFFVVAGLINPHPKTRMVLKGVDLNPTRNGFLTILQKMGGRVKVKNRRDLCGEPVGDLIVLPSKLKGAIVTGKIVPCLIDEVPILAVAGACATGASQFKDMAELRVKETDRIATLEKNFRKLGIRFAATKDSFEIDNAPSPPLKLRGGRGELKSYGDHRIAMSLAILGTILPAPLVIKDVACINTSFPQFFTFLRNIGVKWSLT